MKRRHSLSSLIKENCYILFSSFDLLLLRLFTKQKRNMRPIKNVKKKFFVRSGCAWLCACTHAPALAREGTHPRAPSKNVLFIYLLIYYTT
jgi:hypothetical protein